MGDQWREYVKEEENYQVQTWHPAAEVVDMVDGLSEKAKKMDLSIESEEKKVEKAIKKKGFFGFLRRKKGKDAKPKAKKLAKKGRVQAKARPAKKGLFGFLRRKKAVESDSAGTA